jgi:lysophospholipase L1-like esterase
MGTIGKLMLALASAAMILILLEVGLRVVAGSDSRWNLRLGDHKRPDAVATFRNKENYTFPSGLKTNERGFLAPDGIGTERPEDRIRLLYLGDSVVFFPTTGNFPSKVEEILEEKWQVPVETVNTAVPGYASHNARALFEAEVSDFDADVLIVNLGWNDLGQFGPEGLPYKRAARGYDVGPVGRVLANSFSIRLVYQLQRMVRRTLPVVSEPISPEKLELYDAYYPEHYEENLRAILERARERYDHVFINSLATITSENPTEWEMQTAHFPVGMRKNVQLLHKLVMIYNDVIFKVAGEEGVPVIDLYRTFDDPEARSHMTDSCHVDEAGAEIMARSVAEAIEPAVMEARQRIPGQADRQAS